MSEKMSMQKVGEVMEIQWSWWGFGTHGEAGERVMK